MIHLKTANRQKGGSGKASNGLEITEEEAIYLARPSGFASGYLGMGLSGWQSEVMDASGWGGSRVTLRCCNEAGKTTRILCGRILWHLAMWPKGMAVVTSGSWRQIQNQLMPALRGYGRLFSGWRFLNHSIVVGSDEKFIGFSTSDAGKFEGFHGDRASGAPLFIGVDEAKSVDDQIFEAIERCNPDMLLLVSSTGDARGEFWRSHTSAGASYKRYHITVEDCPWISRERVDGAIRRWGREHPLIKSMFYAEFMTDDDRSVIQLSWVDNLLAEPPAYNGKDKDVHAFCDFAAGGDENVLAIRRGNRVEILKAWRDRDPMSACGQFIVLFKAAGLKPDEITGDADGQGIVMCSALKEAGWPIRMFHGMKRAIDSAHYKNLVTEIWYEGARAIRNKEIILPEDDELRAQLTSRQVRYDHRGLLWLEGKDEMRSRGLPSPDRADAVLGAMSDKIAIDNFSLLEESQKLEWEDGDVEGGDGGEKGQLLDMMGANAGW